MLIVILEVLQRAIAQVGESVKNASNCDGLYFMEENKKKVTVGGGEKQDKFHKLPQ